MSTTESFDPSAQGRPADPDLVRRTILLIGGKLDPEEALALRFEVAEDVRKHLRVCGKPEAPERPLSFPDDDAELVRKVRFAKATRATPEDRNIAGAFGAWRYAIWCAEAEGAARVTQLFDAVLAYDAVLARLPTHPDALAGRAEVVAFLSDEWGFNTAVPEGYVDTREVSERLSRRHDVMPKWVRELRNGPLPRERIQRSMEPRASRSAPLPDSRLPQEREEF